MKVKELESWLSQCDGFDSPKIVYEQYATSAHVASRMIYAAQGDIEGSSVCDLGSGCGILSIGSALVGASYVCGFEIDSDAVEIASSNATEMFDEECDTSLDFVNVDVVRLSEVLPKYRNTFDVVVMNPPFGTKKHVGIDYAFLKQAVDLVRPGGLICSLHKTSTRDFFKKKMQCPQESLGISGDVAAEIRYDLPKCYKFHKEKSIDISVDFWMFRKDMSCQVCKV